MSRDVRRRPTPTGAIRRPSAAALPLLLPILGACSTGSQLPTPRPLVIHSGARITVEPERMAEIDRWVEEAVQTINDDPTFVIYSLPEESVGYPWEVVTYIEADPDTARVSMQSTAPDSHTPYRIYAFLHLMADDDRLEEWLPDAVDATGYELERAIVARTAETWLYGRAVWDTAPFELLDHLIYARENGFLDAFLLTLRAEEFPEAREEWLAANPGRMAEYEAWFRETFDRAPPGTGEE